MNTFFRSFAIGAVVVTVAAIIFQRTAGAAIKQIAAVNEGTPFEGFGPVGTLGNLADKASFGILSKIGGALGRGLFTIFGPGVDE